MSGPAGDLHQAGRAERLAELCRGFNIDILYAFGSRARDFQAWLMDEQAVLAPGPADVDVGVKAAAESCLRRALEALFDLGRHILSKGFGHGVSEYKDSRKLGVGALRSNAPTPNFRNLLVCCVGWR